MLESGQIFAHRYRVNRQIAEGGMGAIFEAEHTATERKVALKLLFPHIMSVASARQKFELEARISARVKSPYIVEVLDAGFDETTKSPYLVMELLDGQTVADHVEQRGPLSVDEALPLLEQMADALDAAHGYREASGAVKPIVHRDLKPENVFMAREHGNFMVKILDFGIAKVLGETSNMSQEVRGTPMYMAVEQITAGVLSPQTDIWALGLIAYYMLTGTPYWKSAHSETANIQSLFAEILSLPIEAPSLRVREYNSKVALPAAFDAWLLKCIDRTPAQRFSSAGVAVAELARAYGRTPRVRAQQPTYSGAKAFAATEAAVSPLQTQATPVAKAGTAASLPGMASEHRSPAGMPVPISRGPLPMLAAAAAGFLVLGGGAWLALGRPGGNAAATSAAAPVAVAVPAPVPTPAPVQMPAPAVAPVTPAAPAPGAVAGAVAVAAPSAAANPVRPVSEPTEPPAPAAKESVAKPAAPKAAPKPRRGEIAAAPAPRKAPAEAAPKRSSAVDAYRMR